MVRCYILGYYIRIKKRKQKRVILLFLLNFLSIFVESSSDTIKIVCCSLVNFRMKNIVFCALTISSTARPKASLELPLGLKSSWWRMLYSVILNSTISNRNRLKSSEKVYEIKIMASQHWFWSQKLIKNSTAAVNNLSHVFVYIRRLCVSHFYINQNARQLIFDVIYYGYSEEVFTAFLFSCPSERPIATRAHIRPISQRIRKSLKIFRLSRWMQVIFH